MKCPKCDDPLTRIRYSGANVRQCNRCHGHLVEQRQVQKIEKRIDKDIDQLEQEKSESEAEDLVDQIRCPRCRNQMGKTAVPKASFHVDECSNCDCVWFDGGELASIQLAFESKPQTQELNRMRDRLASMSPEERKAYKDRIAQLEDLGSPMEQAIQGATFELAYQYYWRTRFW